MGVGSLWLFSGGTLSREPTTCCGKIATLSRIVRSSSFAASDWMRSTSHWSAWVRECPRFCRPCLEDATSPIPELSPSIWMRSSGLWMPTKLHGMLTVQQASQLQMCVLCGISSWMPRFLKPQTDDAKLLQEDAALAQALQAEEEDLLADEQLARALQAEEDAT